MYTYEAPELNMCNYTEEQVETLNDAMVRAHTLLKPAIGELQMPKPVLDYVGDPLPVGYKQWCCPVCTAMCNFEAMQMCAKRFEPEAECGFDQEQPESNFGAFAFIVKGDPDV